ncbi:MAG: hypothetical protein QOJ16_313 [Acidobacteriota bacterium]|jgi:hypothetical protein|nr:hypothetical protein [Acidobacteriota bacterium]
MPRQERDVGRDEAESERQRLSREAAMKFVGTIEGDRLDRAENASAEVRARIASADQRTRQPRRGDGR